MRKMQFIYSEPQTVLQKRITVRNDYTVQFFISTIIKLF